MRRLLGIVNPSETTHALLERARRGDREAFDRLIARYQPELERHVRRRVGAHLRGRVEIDDVLAQTYALAWRGLDGFEWCGEQAFVGWLRAIAERVILSAARVRRGDEIIFLDEPPDSPSEQTSPTRAARREERFDRLQAAVDELSPDHREVLLLVRVQGLQVKEAARRLGRTPNAVTQLLRRALQELRDKLDETDSLGLPDLRGLEGRER